MVMMLTRCAISYRSNHLEAEVAAALAERNPGKHGRASGGERRGDVTHGCEVVGLHCGIGARRHRWRHDRERRRRSHQARAYRKDPGELHTCTCGSEMLALSLPVCSVSSTTDDRRLTSMLVAETDD